MVNSVSKEGLSRGFISCSKGDIGLCFAADLNTGVRILVPCCLFSLKRYKGNSSTALFDSFSSCIQS